jgi:hypothetical protein
MLPQKSGRWKMTIQEIKQSDAMFLTPVQIAPVIGCDPQLIRLQARKDPSKLGFQVTVLGSRTKIPRKPFLEWLGEGERSDE